MPPIWELIAEREMAANAAAEQMREQIAKLTGELALAETELTELAITRKTLMSLTGQAEAQAATVASAAYQQILAVISTAAEGMRAKDVCLALGLGITPKDTEGIRAKLKRLTARHILIEAEPGLFVLAPSTPPPRSCTAADASQGSAPNSAKNSQRSSSDSS